MRTAILDKAASTNSYVLDHTGSLEEWDMVIAKRQTAGRGRNGHRWESPEGGLWFSIYLKGPVESALPLITGVAVSESLGMETCLKWPNDVLVEEKKIAGILVEARGDSIAVGIGVNANFHVDALPEEIRERSTTILDETGMQTEIEALAVSIRGRMMELMKDRENALRMWKELSCTLGRRVRISGNYTIEGYAMDIDERGALLVRTKSGVKRVLFGDCTHL